MTVLLDFDNNSVLGRKKAFTFFN